MFVIWLVEDFNDIGMWLPSEFFREIYDPETGWDFVTVEYLLTSIVAGLCLFLGFIDPFFEGIGRLFGEPGVLYSSRARENFIVEFSKYRKSPMWYAWLPVVASWALVKLPLLSVIVFLAGSLESLLVLVSALVAIAFYVVYERKLMGAIQRRRGPNVVGFWGIAQSLADGLKLLSKEVLVPAKANRFLFIFAPILTIVLSLALWSVLPVSPYSWANIVSTEIDILILFALSSFGVYGIILAGWSSNSKYAFLGALRSASQIISYEVFFSVILLSVFVLAGSASLVGIVEAQALTVWFAIPCLPLAAIFFVALLAETNRAPFDLPEAEAELVAGFNIEYSSMLFALFFLGEYGNMLGLSYLFSLLFLGGWLPPFGLPHLPFGIWAILKTMVIATLFIVVRANVPRYRYDQLMNIGWNALLPLTFSCFLFTAIVAGI